MTTSDHTDLQTILAESHHALALADAATKGEWHICYVNAAHIANIHTTGPAALRDRITLIEAMVKILTETGGSSIKTRSELHLRGLSEAALTVILVEWRRGKEGK